MRRGDLDSWARPNGSGRTEKIDPVQWTGLKLRSRDGHVIAIPVDSEHNPLTLPYSFSEYMAGSVPVTSVPLAWPDPLFCAEQAMRLWSLSASSTVEPALETPGLR